jgi:26S proteasome regulatory subunit N11
MLMNLNKKSWMDGLTLRDYKEHCQLNKVRLKTMQCAKKELIEN